jgi:dTDP-4-dehydrorhamnose reductase
VRILITGGGGQLATALRGVLAGEDLAVPTAEELDITRADAVAKGIGDFAPDVVINTAAIPQVEACELHPEQAMEVNCLGVRNVAMACQDQGAALVQLSTDYVFSGDKTTPYTEEDTPQPLNVYGVSKLAAEHLVQSICPRHYLVRTAGLFGTANGVTAGNFVLTMLRLAQEGRQIRVITDQVLSPTYTVDLAAKIAQVLHTERYGIYHIVNQGQCSRFELAQKIFEFAGVAVDLVPVTTKGFGGGASRPSYTVLRNARLASMGLDDLRPWEAALAAHLGSLGVG